MKRIISQTILTSTILGLSVVPVFAAAGQAPHMLILKGSAAAYHAELRINPLVHRVQSTGEEGDGEGFGGFEGESIESEMDYGDDSESDQRFKAVGTDTSARGIVNQLKESEGFCRLLDSPTKIDCFADSLASIARSLADEGDSGVVKKALNDAVRKLDAIVTANAEPGAPLVKPRVETNRRIKKTSSRPLRKIAPAKQAQANAQARAVVDELSTVLLRSAENSSKRKAYYARIADAVDSNKVLLRST